MRIGIFGGSFDPIHYGHLILAEQCREQVELDKVLFVPAAISPFKSDGPIANDKQRLEMLSLAIAGHSKFEISSLEIERGGKSFTIDTLTQLKNETPDAELFLLLGEDSLQSFDRWKEPEGICKLATPLVVRRPGQQPIDEGDTVDLSGLKNLMNPEQFERANELAVHSRMIEISGTDIRARIGNGKSVRYLLPRAVEKYIETQKLYLPK